MTQLVITRGYPASGKSTWAKELAGRPGWARVCRDDLREMLFGRGGVLAEPLEALVTSVEQRIAATLLAAEVNVVVDATNLRHDHAQLWEYQARRHEAAFSAKDFRVDAETCVIRDAERKRAGERAVGADVIREMARRYPIDNWPDMPVYPPG